VAPPTAILAILSGGLKIQKYERKLSTLEKLTDNWFNCEPTSSSRLSAKDMRNVEFSIAWTNVLNFPTKGEAYAISLFRRNRSHASRAAWFGFATQRGAVKNWGEDTREYAGNLLDPISTNCA
jgi:hypothetical protein